VLLDLAWPVLVWFTERIFKEDRWAVEREQEAHDAQGADWNREVFPVINDLRDLLRRCGSGYSEITRSPSSASGTGSGGREPGHSPHHS
jgi:hypothetical protein